MLLGAVSGNRGLALSIAAAVAAAYLISSLAPVIDWLSPARYFWPFYWALGAGVSPQRRSLTAGVGAQAVREQRDPALTGGRPNGRLDGNRAVRVRAGSPLQPWRSK
jgi:hypothetical protein